MKVCVFGAGAIGSYVGGCLVRAGADVRFLARGAQLDALRQRGVTVRSAQEEFHVAVTATDDAASIRGVDLVIFAVKTYDTASAAPLAAAMLAPTGRVLTLQNGLAPQQRYAGVLDATRMLAGAPFIFAELTAPGVVTRLSGGARVVFGAPAATPESMRDVAALLRVPGLAAEASGAIDTVLWERLIVACAVNGVTAALRLPLGAVMDSPEHRATFSGAAQEVHALGTKVGISLAPDFVSKAMAQVDTIPKHAESSLYRDLLSGHRLELDALNGAVVELGRAHEVPTPINASITGTLRPHAQGASAAGAP